MKSHALNNEFFESLKQLLVNIQIIGAKRVSSSLLITSPSDKSGKTFIATNLANQAASIGIKTLIFDLNVTNYEASTVYKTKENSYQLKSNSQYTKLIKSTTIDNLSILSFANFLRPNSSFIYSPQIEELIDKLMAQFELIIVDAPSTLNSAIPSIISSYVTNSILVIRQGKESKSNCVNAFNQLQKFSKGKVNLVMNDYQEKLDI